MNYSQAPKGDKKKRPLLVTRSQLHRVTQHLIVFLKKSFFLKIKVRLTCSVIILMPHPQANRNVTNE